MSNPNTTTVVVNDLQVPTAPAAPAKTPMAPAGLTERIKNAATVEEIDTLLAEGATYKAAHPSTQRRWNKFATKRRAFLGTKSA